MNNAMKEEALGAVERGGTIYAKRSFNPETNSNQIELNDPEFWEKMLQPQTAACGKRAGSCGRGWCV